MPWHWIVFCSDRYHKLPHRRHLLLSVTCQCPSTGLILAPQPRHSELWAKSQPCDQPGFAARHSGDGMGMYWVGDGMRMGWGQGWGKDFHGDASGMVVGWGWDGDAPGMGMPWGQDALGTRCTRMRMGQGWDEDEHKRLPQWAQPSQGKTTRWSRNCISPAAPWARRGFRSRSNHGRGSELGAPALPIPQWGFSPCSSWVWLGSLTVLNPADYVIDFQSKVSILEVSVQRPDGTVKII